MLSAYFPLWHTPATPVIYHTLPIMLRWPAPNPSLHMLLTTLRPAPASTPPSLHCSIIQAPLALLTPPITPTTSAGPYTSRPHHRPQDVLRAGPGPPARRRRRPTGIRLGRGGPRRVAPLQVRPGSDPGPDNTLSDALHSCRSCCAAPLLGACVYAPLQP